MKDDQEVLLAPPEMQNDHFVDTNKMVFSKRQLFYRWIGLTLGLLGRIVYDAWTNAKAWRTWGMK